MGSVTRLFGVLIEWSRAIRFARTIIAFGSITGLVSGFCCTALVAAINAALKGDTRFAGLKLSLVFTVLCVLAPVSGLTSQVLLIRLTAQAAKDLRLQLARKIMGVPYRMVEELGAGPLLAVFTDDIANASTAITSLPVLIMQIGIMVGSLVYLGWLSRMLLVAVLAYMALGILVHAIPMTRSVAYFRKARDAWDAMFDSFRGLVQGAKELKLNSERRTVFLAEQLEPAVEANRKNHVWANALSLAAGNVGQALFFAFIGILVFVTPRFLRVDPSATTGYALTILFMITPLTIILNTMPLLGRAYVAAEKIRKIGLSLKGGSIDPPSKGRLSAQWQRLELAGVTHSYRGKDAKEDFRVGPIDLAIRRGELVFFVGGNGSGKTTIAKLVTGLYEPDAGEIRLDGRCITAENRDEYRQEFSTVFSDFHLFERLLGAGQDDPGIEERARAHLAELELGAKVGIAAKKLSTLDLSSGQRRRLALLVAYLEDRSTYVFDEWAADQDPAFREMFYRRILPDLKAKGKTIIAITHDDRYFDVADRVIKFDRGQVECDSGANGARVPELLAPPGREAASAAPSAIRATL